MITSASQVSADESRMVTAAAGYLSESTRRKASQLRGLEDVHDLECCEVAALAHHREPRDRHHGTHRAGVRRRAGCAGGSLSALFSGPSGPLSDPFDRLLSWLTRAAKAGPTSSAAIGQLQSLTSSPHTSGHT